MPPHLISGFLNLNDLASKGEPNLTVSMKEDEQLLLKDGQPLIIKQCLLLNFNLFQQAEQAFDD